MDPSQLFSHYIVSSANICTRKGREQYFSFALTEITYSGRLLQLWEDILTALFDTVLGQKKASHLCLYTLEKRHQITGRNTAKWNVVFTPFAAKTAPPPPLVSGGDTLACERGGGQTRDRHCGTLGLVYSLWAEYCH